MKPDDDILLDIELPDAMTPEERLRRIARLILKAIRIRQAKQSKPDYQPKPESANEKGSASTPLASRKWPLGLHLPVILPGRSAPPHARSGAPLIPSSSRTGGSGRRQGSIGWFKS